MTYQHGPGQQADVHEMRLRDQAAIDSMRKAGMTFGNDAPSWASYGVRGTDGKMRYYR